MPLASVQEIKAERAPTWGHEIIHRTVRFRHIEAGITLCVESVIGSERGRECVKLEEQIIMTEKGVERQSSYPFAMEML